MPRFLYYFTLLFLLSVGIFSCKLESLTDTIVVPEVEKEFYIDLWEELTPAGRQLVFQVQTIRSENCRNYTVGHSYSRQGNRMRISLEEILPPVDECLGGTGPATAEINAGDLTGGFYDLDIALSNTVNNEGQMMVNGNRYSITMDDPAGIILLHKELMRIPNQTIWGYLTYNDPDDLSIAAQLLAELQPQVYPLELSDGYYGYLTVRKDATPSLVIRDQPEGEPVLPFTYRIDPGNETTIRALIDQYRNTYGDRLSIVLNTWEGESW